MTNPTLTAETLRALILDVVTEVVGKRPDTAARNAVPKADRAKVDYDALAIKAFRKAGYGEVKPRIDTKTYNLWLAEGFRVKPGEKSIAVKQLRLFHRSQCEAMSASEKRQAMAKLEAKRTSDKLPPVSPVSEPPKPAPKATSKAKAKAKVIPISEVTAAG
jgi:hypothetical protein